MTDKTESKAAKTAPAAENLRRFLGGDQSAVGTRIARELVQGNERFEKARADVEQSLRRGGRIAKGSFSL